MAIFSQIDESEKAQAGVSSNQLANALAGGKAIGDTGMLASVVTEVIKRAGLTKGQHQLCVFGNSISESLNNYGLALARASDGAIVFYKNAGVGGNNTNQMVARLTDIEGTLMLIMEATNDAAAGVDFTLHRDNIASSVEYALVNGIASGIVMSPTHGTQSRAEYIFEANLYDYVTARKKGVPCLNGWDSFTNPVDGSWNVAQAAAGLNPNSAFALDDNTDGIPNNWATNGNQSGTALNDNERGVGNQWNTSWSLSSQQLFLNSSRWDVEAGKTYRCEIDCGLTLNSGTIDFDVFVQYDVTVGVDRQYIIDSATASVTRKTRVIEFEVPEGVSSLRFAASIGTTTANVDLVLAQANIVEADDPQADVWLPQGNVGDLEGGNDITHPRHQAEQMAGEAMGKQLADGRYYIPLPRINGFTVPQVIVNDNSCFMNDANADGVPDNWYTNGNQVSSKLLKTGLGLGNTWRTRWVNTQIYLNSNYFTVTPGDRYLCVMRLGIKIKSGKPKLRVYVRYNATVNSVDSVFMVYDAFINIDNQTLTSEFEVPTGVTGLGFYITASNGSHDVEINLAQCQMFNLSHYGI